MPNLLTPLEMHLEVFQGLQKVDSFQQDMFLPEEIDLQLNKQQDRFIEDLVNKQFQDRQVRLDYIKNIIVKNRTLKALLPTESDSFFEKDVFFSLLPSNYLHLINDRSRIVYPKDCTSLETFTVDPQGYKITFAVTPFPETSDPDQNSFYTGFEILVVTSTGGGGGGDVGIQVAPGPVYSTRFDNPDGSGSILTDIESKNLLIRDVLENFDRNQFEGDIYWENFNNEYYPESFIFVTEGEVSASVTLVVRYFKEDSITVDREEVVFDFQEKTFPTALDFTNDSAIESKAEYVENKSPESDSLYLIRKNKFYRPVKKEPHSTLGGDYLYVYRDKSYIVTDIQIDYIRKPRQISLALNQACELAGTAPRLIVDQTIEYLKLIIENPAYSTVLQDNQLRNQNTITNG